MSEIGEVLVHRFRKRQGEVHATVTGVTHYPLSVRVSMAGKEYPSLSSAAKAAGGTSQTGGFIGAKKADSQAYFLKKGFEFLQVAKVNNDYPPLQNRPHHAGPPQGDAGQFRPGRHRRGLLLRFRFCRGCRRNLKVEQDPRPGGPRRRPTLEAVAAGLHQARPLEKQLEISRTIRRSQRTAIASEAAGNIAQDVSALSQTDDSEKAVERLRQLVTAGFLEIHTYPREFLHAKAYLCWYDNHAEPGAAIVGSSNFTLAGFQGNTELNVRVTGDAEMAELSRWFETLWEDSIDISDQVAQVLTDSWAIKRYPPYLIYLKALYELYGHELDSGDPLPLEPARQEDLANFQLDAVRRGPGHDPKPRRLLHRRRRGPGQDLHRGGTAEATTAELPQGRKPADPMPGRAGSNVGAVQPALPAGGRSHLPQQNRCAAPTDIQPRDRGIRRSRRRTARHHPRRRVRPLRSRSGG